MSDRLPFKSSFKVSSSPSYDSHKYDPHETVPFGFQEVSAREKTEKVQDVFHRVADRYDLMNDVMSLGVHRLWKREMVKTIQLRPGMNIIDIAGGTGDIGYKITDTLKSQNISGQVTLCDLNPSMLIEGKRHASMSASSCQLNWVCGNAEDLPFPSNSVDVYTIAFGLRNVTYPNKALKEAARVLKPGGQFLCLEFSRLNFPVLETLYKAYSFHLLPWFGDFIAGDRAAYQYLVESIARFPSQNKLCSQLSQAGLSHIKYRNFAFGVASLHTAWNI